VLYNSFHFIFLFLPLCLLLYFLSARLSRGLANVVLAVMSFIFYAYWDWQRLTAAHPVPTNLLLLLGSIVFNYAVGAAVRRRPSRALLAFGIAVNLAVLGYFKYFNFGLQNLAVLLNREIKPWQIALPLGISFFTFTQIAFLADAYRGQAKELDFWRYCLFVAFFPHLIAGPIVHHGELMPQFATPAAKRWTPPNLHIGLAFFTLGLFKKVVLADTCGPWADEVFSRAPQAGCLDAWRGALAYTFQLYFDFSGYSDMAIGLGMLFNVRLPDNFDAPYRAQSIADFWRRWHMTLSRFLRDYIYIPLGGNRRGEPRRQFNLLVTMFLGGIWHGAGWTYVIWGTYHGLLLVLNHAWTTRNIRLPLVLSRAITFLAVLIGWVLFRAASLHDAGRLLRAMSGLGRSHAPLGPWSLVQYQLGFLGLLVVFVNVAPTTKQWIESRPLADKRAAALGFLFFLALLWMRNSLLTNAPSQFIYFQF